MARFTTLSHRSHCNQQASIIPIDHDYFSLFNLGGILDYGEPTNNVICWLVCFHRGTPADVTRFKLNANESAG